MIILDGHHSAIGARVNLSRGAGRRCPRPDVGAVAYHEAGHAVVGTTYGLAVRRATILATLDTYGCVWYTPESWDKVPMDVQLLALLAGQAAQDQASYRYPLPHLRFDVSDVAGARTILAQQFDCADWHAAPVESELAKYREHVGHSVNAAWSWIDRVARELLIRKCLTRADIEGLRR